ncbi:MAG TPA: hypothetical protein VGB74_21965 [Actinoplanes sp.]|jgi:hypothetical protein
MTMYESPDLHKRVERYEAAVDELRAAQQDVRSVLVDQLLFERWQQIGAEVGFVPARQDVAEAFVNGHPDSGQQQQQPQQPGLVPHPNQQIPQMSESWAS